MEKSHLSGYLGRDLPKELEEKTATREMSTGENISWLLWARKKSWVIWTSWPHHSDRCDWSLCHLHSPHCITLKMAKTLLCVREKLKLRWYNQVFLPRFILVVDGAWHLLISSFYKYEPLMGYLLRAICSGSIDTYEIHTLETVCKIYVGIFLRRKVHKFDHTFKPSFFL